MNYFKIKKNLILLVTLFFIATLSYAQEGRVGINTTTPAATLDVFASVSDLTKTDGFIAPRITGNELKAKDALYATLQTGVIVYATAAAVPTTSKTINVTKPGYFYFDGTVWVGFDISKPITFFKSNTQQYVADILNNQQGTNAVATFTNANSLINQATTFNSATSYFTLLKAGVYEFSGTICFNPGRANVSPNHSAEGHGDLGINERVIINVQVQFSTDGGNTWNGITGMRKVFTKAEGELNSVISTPIALRELPAGTLIRLALNRPNINNSEVAGTDANTGAATSYNNINTPSGLDFTKLIKIQMLQ